MAGFYEYLRAFFSSWFVYMTAGPFVLDEIFGRLCPNARDKFNRKFPKKIRRRVEVAILLIGVFYAGFAAFKEEYDALQAKLNAPPQPISITETDPQARTEINS